MPESQPDRFLVQLWQTGDQEAARQIFNRYVDSLLKLARSYLSLRLARRVDPEDIVQSAFRTFFDRARAGQFHVEEADDLCKLLTRITLHKTLRQVAFHQAAKRTPAREVGPGAEDQDRLQELLAREPTPETVSLFLDELKHLINHLRPQEQEIIQMRLEGYDNVEIAEKLGISDRTIRRLLERLRSSGEQGREP